MCAVFAWQFSGHRNQCRSAAADFDDARPTYSFDANNSARR